jgi:tryptophanyl-tRNA synthetase
VLGELTPETTPAVLTDQLGSLTRRFSHTDQADTVLAADQAGPLGIITGFGPTNAPTAGTLTVMLGIVELQRRFDVPTTVVISELGAWNSRNVPWDLLCSVRDQMMDFLQAIGFDADRGILRSHLDLGNLTRAGMLARFLSRQDFQDHREDLLELYDDHGLLGSEVGLTVDGLYTVADILGPVEQGAKRVLMVSGQEEAYFTQLARIALDRQAAAGDLSLGWQADIGALYFRVLEGLNGYPKMSKSIPASSIHLGMPDDELAERILSDAESSQPALLSAIELSSGWDDDRLDQVRTAYEQRDTDPGDWKAVRLSYLDTFREFSALWKSCAR